MTAIYVFSKEGSKTRIFSSPEEYSKFREELNDQYRKIADAYIRAGCRPIEMRRLFKHPEWFDRTRRVINLPIGSLRKGKAKKTRTVMLTLDGALAIERFLALDLRNGLPSDSAMFQAFALAATKSGIEGGSEGVNVKGFRKTALSWLIVWNEDKVLTIGKSMGHSINVMQNDYLGLGFMKAEKESICKWNAGWGEA